MTYARHLGIQWRVHILGISHTNVSLISAITVDERNKNVHELLLFLQYATMTTKLLLLTY